MISLMQLIKLAISYIESVIFLDLRKLLNGIYYPITSNHDIQPQFELTFYHSYDDTSVLLTR